MAETKPLSHSRRAVRVRGFTLVETMLAAAVAALAISTSVVVVQRAFGMLDSARNLTLAGQILQSEIERIRLLDWTAVSALPEGPAMVPIGTVFSEVATVAGRFGVVRQVSSPDANLREITVTATWQAPDGRQISRSQRMHVGRYGLGVFAASDGF